MKAACVGHEATHYRVLLHHDSGGQEVNLDNVSERNLEFIKENLGRDIIYVQGCEIYINLRRFSIAEVSLKNVGKSDGKNKV